MILQIINIVVTVVLVYFLWNKKYVTNTHIHIVFDHAGKLVKTVEAGYQLYDTNGNPSNNESHDTPKENV